MSGVNGEWVSVPDNPEQSVSRVTFEWEILRTFTGDCAESVEDGRSFIIFYDLCCVAVALVHGGIEPLRISPPVSDNSTAGSAVGGEFNEISVG